MSNTDPATGPQTPEEEADRLRGDIAETREELGDTVEALSHKADVKAQARGAVDEQKEKLRAKRDELRQKMSGAGDHGEGGGDAGQRVQAVAGQLAQRASRQPLPYLAGALSLGVFAGLLLRGRNQ